MGGDPSTATNIARARRQGAGTATARSIARIRRIRMARGGGVGVPIRRERGLRARREARRNRGGGPR